ncbi:MAG TPA: 50S ribosomal protein L10 [Anaerolineaceae bacterium]|nr:50S ribosomal protein L10 [Anaerolineaceae bacterium]
MAFTKQHKAQLLKQYNKWLKQSQAVFVLQYTKMNMKEVDTLRGKVRDAGGELHVVKNTLMELALENSGIESKTLVGTCLFGFAINDIPALAKVFGDVTKNSEIFKLKGGYLSGHPITPENVKALADMPPLPVLRSRLLGLLNTPASQLVRTLAEPARQVAYLLKAYSEQTPA